MTKLQELEKAIKEEREKQETLAFNTLAEKVKAFFHNRCYIRKFVSTSGAWTGIVTVSAILYKVKLDKDRKEIRMTSEVITASTAKQYSRAKWREGVSYCTDSFIEIKDEINFLDLQKNIVAEIPAKQFHSLCQSVDTLGAAFAEKLVGPNSTVIDFSTEPLDVDLPTVQLEPHETCYAKGWFVLPDYKMILTPNSRATVLEQIRRERESDSRISHLVESCDMAYLSRKADTLNSLEHKMRI